LGDGFGNQFLGFGFRDLVGYHLWIGRRFRAVRLHRGSGFGPGEPGSSPSSPSSSLSSALVGSRRFSHPTIHQPRMKIPAAPVIQRATTL
jgi:hypothetical protein